MRLILETGKAFLQCKVPRVCLEIATQHGKPAPASTAAVCAWFQHIHGLVLIVTFALNVFLL